MSTTETQPQQAEPEAHLTEAQLAKVMQEITVIRISVTVMVWIMVICFVASLIIGTIAAVQLVHVAHTLAPSQISSSCASMGGWDTTC